MKVIHCEIIKASKYYGKHATGHVVLVNGYPSYHETGSKTSLQDCRDYVKGLLKLTKD